MAQPNKLVPVSTSTASYFFSFETAAPPTQCPSLCFRLHIQPLKKKRSPSDIRRSTNRAIEHRLAKEREAARRNELGDNEPDLKARKDAERHVAAE